MNLENQQGNFDLSEESAGMVDLSDLIGEETPVEKQPEDNLLQKVEEELEKEEDLPEEKKEKEIEALVPPQDKVDEEGEEVIKPDLSLDDVIESKTDYKKVIKTLWGNDIESLIQEDEEGNEVEVSIDDIDVTEEMFTDIVNSKLTEIEEKYKGRVSTENVSEFTKSLIEIEKRGGNVREALELYQTVQDPLENLDMDTEQGQAQAIIMKLRAKGTPDEDIRDLLDLYIAKGELEERGLSAKEELEAASKKKMEWLEQEAIRRDEEHKAALKNYRKEFKTNLQKVNVKDSVRVKILNAATKVGEDGMYELDKVYNELRRDPEKAAELAFYLMDRENFVKLVTESAVTAEKKKTVSKLKLVPTKQKSSLVDKQQKSDSDFVDLDDLIN